MHANTSSLSEASPVQTLGWYHQFHTGHLCVKIIKPTIELASSTLAIFVWFQWHCHCHNLGRCSFCSKFVFKIVKLRQGSGKDRQGMARNGSQGERPQSLNPCQELTLKLVATHPPPPPPTHHPQVSLHLTNGQVVDR